MTRVQSLLTADTGCVIGLGTLVGDAVEIGAVMETIAGLGNKLLTGSYKANTGHTYTGILPFSQTAHKHIVCRCWIACTF